jgi:hypothetical protein
MLVICPICAGLFNGNAAQTSGVGDKKQYECDYCGKFEITNSVKDFDSDHSQLLSKHQRAIFSHLCRNTTDAGGTYLITSDEIKRVKEEGRLPTPHESSIIFLLFLANHERNNGERLWPHLSLIPRMGLVSEDKFNSIILELEKRGVINKYDYVDDPSHLSWQYELTLKGWETIDQHYRGKSSNNFAFIALKFQQEILDELIDKIVKPALRTHLSLEAITMLDVQQAGIIDNIMRNKIRDCALVLADLSHDNPGAYWEAGFAEGLGKPVIYLCEKEKFERDKTHFDTNHCTTIPWSKNAEDTEAFIERLVATIRRSLSI